MPVLQRILLLASSALIGVVVALFVADKTVVKQAEAYGVFFAVFFLFLMPRDDKPLKIPRLLLSATVLLLSVSMKDPFLLSIFAAVFVSSSSLVSLVRKFFIPAVIAAILGIILLFIFGYTSAYFSVYLPEMIFGVSEINGSPLLVRGLWFEAVMRKAASSNAMLFPFLGFMSFSIFYLRCSWHKPFRGAAGLAFIFSGAVFLVFSLSHILSALFASSQNLPSVGYLLPVALIILGKFIISSALSTNEFRHLIYNFLRLFTALFLSVIAVNSGFQLYEHHIVLILPFFLGILFALLDALPSNWSETYSGITFSAVLLIFSVLMAITRVPADVFLQPLKRISREDSYEQQLTSRFDLLLENCGYKRFLSLTTGSLWSHTSHSPLGPGFLPSFFVKNIDPKTPFFYKSFLRNLQQGQILIADKEGWSWFSSRVDHWDEIITQFGYSKIPPPCAAPYIPFGDYQLLFRSGTGSTKSSLQL